MRRVSSFRRMLGVALVGLIALTVGCSDSGSTDAAADVKIKIFEVAQADVVTQLETSFKDKLTEVLAPRTVTFEVKNAGGDPTLIQSIARDMSRSDASLIAVIGTPAVLAMAQADNQHPIVAVAMGDPVGGGVADSLDAPGSNVTGTIDFIDPSALLDELEKVQPAPQRIGTVFDPSNDNSQTWIRQLRTAVADHPGLSLVETTVATGGDVQSASRALVGRVDSILIGPDATVSSSIATVGAVALGDKLPLYMTSGDASVGGVLATLGPDYTQLGADAATLAGKIVDGANPAVTPFGRPGALQWDVNQTTLDQLGVTLPVGATAS